MTLPVYVVGVDPGPIPGVVALSYINGRLCNAQVFQCSWGSAVWLVRSLLTGAQPTSATVLAVERFVVGPRAGRSSTPRAGQITRDLVGALTAPEPGWRTVTRTASDVMPWSTDKRLDAAGLLATTRGMQHARAAARHALYAAVSDCGIPDPLSTRSSSSPSDHRSPR